ncbi:MAG: hypothetical protein AAGF23_21670, partial [Acidobacteriota bacterium]
ADPGLFVEPPGDLYYLAALCFGTAGAYYFYARRARARDDADAARLLSAYSPLGDDAKSRLMAGVQAELEAARRGPRRVPGQPRRAEGSTEATAGQGGAAHRTAHDPKTADGRRTANDNARRAGRREKADGVEPADEGQTDAPADPEGVVVPITRGRPARRRWLPQAVAAVAAVLLCVVLWPRPHNPLPVYQLSAESTTRKMRSVPTAPSARPVAGEDVLTLAPGETFEIVLRPASAVDDAVAAVYALRGSDFERTALSVEVSENGSVRVRGRFDAALRGSADTVELRVVVSGRGSLPGPEELASSAAQGGAQDGTWRILRLILETAPKGVL